MDQPTGRAGQRVDAKVDPLAVLAAMIPQLLADRPVFQRIMELATRSVVGAEALARGPG
jgi:EAL domain-containing protein (putative c-di-GMP-specific phosphodiesterase class I)